MGNGKLYSTYSQLPTWAKGVIATLGVGTIIVSGFLVYKGIKRAVTSSGQSNQQAQDDLSDLSKKGIKPSYSDTQFATWSEKLAYALAYNTDENMVYQVMGFMKNTADILKLVQVFGTREVETFPFIFQKATLGEAITSAMNTSEIAKVNKILSDKKIKFQF
jgi:hypothetical protein